MKNIFHHNDAEEVINRINCLNPDTKNLWGKMNVAQMLAHCNVTYEMAYEDKHPKPTGIKKLLLKLFIKSAVVSEKPYKKSTMTAPQFIIAESKDFEIEKNRLVDYVRRTQQLGGEHFNNKESHGFGPLSEKEWNNMFYKHLDHHLTQFGV